MILFIVPAVGELWVLRHVGRAADLVLVPGDQDVVLGQHDVRLDDVRTLSDGQRVRRQRVLGAVATGAAVRDHRAFGFLGSHGGVGIEDDQLRVVRAPGSPCPVAGVVVVAGHQEVAVRQRHQRLDRPQTEAERVPGSPAVTVGEARRVVELEQIDDEGLRQHAGAVGPVEVDPVHALADRRLPVEVVALEHEQGPGIDQLGIGHQVGVGVDPVVPGAPGVAAAPRVELGDDPPSAVAPRGRPGPSPGSDRGSDRCATSPWPRDLRRLGWRARGNGTGGSRTRPRASTWTRYGPRSSPIQKVPSGIRWSDSMSKSAPVRRRARSPPQRSGTGSAGTGRPG